MTKKGGSARIQPAYGNTADLGKPRALRRKENVVQTLGATNATKSMRETHRGEQSEAENRSEAYRSHLSQHGGLAGDCFFVEAASL